MAGYGYGAARTWQSLGQGLTGLGSAIAGQRRQKLEDERDAADRAEQASDRQARWAMELVSKGGGTGPRPTTTATIEGTGSRPDEETSVDIFAPPARPSTSIGVRPGGTGKIGVTPPKAPSPIAAPSITGPLTYQKPDEDYAAIGDIGYVKTPKALETEEELKKADVGYGIGEAIAGAHPNGQSPKQRTQAGMAIANGAPWQAVTPDLTPTPPTRGQVVQRKDGQFVVVDPTVEGDTGVQGRVPPTPGETTPAQEKAQRIAAAKALLDLRNKIEGMTVDGVPIPVEERARRITEGLRNSGFTSYNEARDVARQEQVGRPLEMPHGSVGTPAPIDPTAPPTRPAATPVEQPGVSPDEDKQDAMNTRMFELFDEGLTNEEVMARLREEGF